jgi:tetratricopeptide (TPR) repeat protein
MSLSIMRHPAKVEQNLARAAEALGRGDLALAQRHCRIALAIEPHNPEVLGFLGSILLRVGQPTAARRAIEQALAADPAAAPLHDLRGDTLAALGDLPGAMAAWRAALAQDVAYVPAMVSLADASFAQGDTSDAVALLRQAIALAPEEQAAPIWDRLANVLHATGDSVGAQAARQRVAQLPDANAALAQVTFDLAIRRQVAEDHESGELLLHATLRHQPDHAHAHHDLAHLLLKSGRLVEGWAELEWRHLALGEKSRTAGPRWAGQTAPDRLLVVLFEQGHGDFIQFCRYLPQVAQRVRVAVEVPAALQRLAHSLPGLEQVVLREQGMSGFDYYLPIMSLAHIFGTTLESIPSQVPYLAAPADAVASWRARLAGQTGRKIGMAWSGSPTYLVDMLRSVPPDLFAPLAGLENCCFVSLQVGAAALPPIPLLDWTNELTDFAETAALIEALDLVIAVDTAVAHLAGALGKPVWLLNRHDSDWRWDHRGADRGSAWYPTMRVFQETATRTWPEVIGRVVVALKAETPEIG